MIMRYASFASKGALAALVLASVATLGPGSAAAQSPVIEAQQSKYHALKKLWERSRVPSGLVGEGDGKYGASARDSGTGRVAMKLENVDFEYAVGIGFWVKNLVLTLEPKAKGAPLDFDRIDQFVIRIQRGDVIVRASALSALFNNYLVTEDPKPLSEVRVTTGEGVISVDAKVLFARIFKLPARFSGPILITEDNKLKVAVKNVSAFGIPVGGLMKLLGMGLTTLVTLDRPGLALGPFNVDLDHRSVFPMPDLAGNISAAELQQDGLHLSFRDAEAVEFPDMPKLSGSYIWLQSGDPKFFGAVVTNARIAILPRVAGRNLHFNLYGYREQFSQGEARILQNGILTVRLPVAASSNPEDEARVETE